MGLGIKVLLVLVAIYFLAKCLAKDIVNLSKDGWVLYHIPGCQHCEQQLSDIGWKTVFLKNINCKENKIQCSVENISAYPTWKNSKTGQIHMGGIEMDKLVSTLASAPVQTDVEVDMKSNQDLGL